MIVLWSKKITKNSCVRPQLFQRIALFNRYGEQISVIISPAEPSNHMVFLLCQVPRRRSQFPLELFSLSWKDDIGKVEIDDGIVFGEQWYQIRVKLPFIFRIDADDFLEELWHLLTSIYPPLRIFISSVVRLNELLSYLIF